MESQDTKQIKAVKDVISKCILSKGIKVERLSTFDIEYLFLNIRGKSVGDKLKSWLLVLTMVRHKYQHQLTLIV